MLEDYEFEINEETKKHIERHLQEVGIGSVFLKEVFPNAQKLIEFALDNIKDYPGKMLVKEIKMPYPIGLDAVVSLDELPKNVEIKKETRDDITVNVVYGIRRKSTDQIVIVAGPLDDLGYKGKHGIRTIYPGKYCPDFTDENFWSKHAFVVER